MKIRALVVVGTFAFPAILSAQWDSTSTEAVAPGVTHKRLVVNSGPWRINVLEVDLTNPRVSIHAARAHDTFTGRETVRSMSDRYKGPGKVVGAVNADFFNVKTGESENNVLIEGNLSKGVTISDSPYDKFNNLHAEIGFDWKNHPYIERFGLKGSVKQGNRSLALDGVNFVPPFKSNIEIFTPAVGDSSPADTLKRKLFHLPLKFISRNGNTSTYRIAGPVGNGERASTASGGLLVAEGAKADEMVAMAKRGGTIRVTTELVPGHGNLRTVVGGWPRVVRNGRSVGQYADIEEGTFPKFSSARHPRTAAGISKDGKTLYLMTVDGRRESDGGMSLAEVGETMVKLGAYQAMNFDGGGSTTMIVDGRLVNHPSDQTGERAVGSALLVVAGK